MLRISSILLLFFGVANLCAQELIHYTTKDGLPSNHVYDIAQDTAGFMWFATNRGVVKFDGVNFKTFTIKDGLPNNDTWKLETDFQGRIWYFSKSNYQGYIQNDSIYKFITLDSMVISPTHISKGKDRLWINETQIDKFMTLEDGLLKRTIYEDYSYEIDKVSERLNKMGKKIYSVFFNPEVKEFVVLQGNELIIIDINNNIVFQKKYNVLDKINLIVYGSILDHTSYAAGEEGLLLINHKIRSFKYFSFQELIGVSRVKGVFCKPLLNEMQVSVSGYLMRFNYNFDLLEILSFPKHIPNHLSYRDMFGNIWLLDNGIGIIFQSNMRAETNYYLPGRNIQKVGMIDQSLFVGIPNDGLYKYNLSEDSFTLAIPQESDKIYQISYDQELKSGFFLTNNLVSIYKKGNFSHLSFDEENYVHSYKRIVNFNNALYALTRTALIKRNLSSKIEQKITDKQGLIVAEPYNNSLFIGASDGLYLLKNDRLERPNISGVFLSTSVLSLLSSKDFLIVGTDGRGIFLYNGKEVFHLKNTDDLSIQKIIQNDHNLWVASQKGIFKINLDTLNPSNSKITNAFLEEDGLLGNNTNDIYIQDCFLYAASNRGLVKLDLKDEIYRKEPKLYFKTVSDTLQLKGGNNSINIDFAVLDYANQANFTYAYRLQPDQEDWFNTESKTLNFSNLSPKLYTLEVKARDQHGNQKIAKQHLVVNPAWWQTVWAKIGFTIMLGTLLWGVLKFFQIQIHKKAERDKRMAGLELQALRSQMNPHFVHNSLNAIQYYIQRSEISLSEKYLVKFSKLIRLFFEYSRKQHISILDEVQLLNNYLEIEKLRFEEKLQYRIQVDERIDQAEQLMPSMILQPIVENAVNHGLFHKKGVGTIEISFNYLNDIAFEVHVKDDGIGIKKAKAIFDNSSKNYQSRSSDVLQERLALLKQSNHWEILYQMEDLSATDASSGTLVTLTFNQLDN